MLKEFETGTHPSQLQTHSSHIGVGELPAYLLNFDLWAVDEPYIQSAGQTSGQHFMQNYLEAFRPQRYSNYVDLWLAYLAHLVAGDLDLLASRPYPVTDRELWKREVESLLNEAGKANWDGEGALALDPETVDIAKELVDRFPRYATRPDVAATPHGEVDFDWVVSKEVMLTISVGPSKEIVFAGLFLGARLSGSEPWSGDLPHFVNCCFERLRDAQST